VEVKGVMAENDFADELIKQSLALNGKKSGSTVHFEESKVFAQLDQPARPQPCVFYTPFVISTRGGA
jgi:hypothetical protein